MYGSGFPKLMFIAKKTRCKKLFRLNMIDDSRFLRRDPQIRPKVNKSPGSLLSTSNSLGSPADRVEF